MRKLLACAGFAVVLVTFALASPTHAASSEQLVFSGIGSATVGPFGNWIWCEAESENPYDGACNGSMYFYAQHITEHVVGFVTEDPPESGLYVMTVWSKDGSISCTLTNTAAAVHGPHNTVVIDCSAPATTGSSDTEVVNVTGP